MLPIITRQFDIVARGVGMVYDVDEMILRKLATQSTIQLQLLKWKEVPEGVGCE